MQHLVEKYRHYFNESVRLQQIVNEQQSYIKELEESLETMLGETYRITPKRRAVLDAIKSDAEQERDALAVSNSRDVDFDAIEKGAAPLPPPKDLGDEARENELGSRIARVDSISQLGVPQDIRKKQAGIAPGQDLVDALVAHAAGKGIRIPAATDADLKKKLKRDRTFEKMWGTLSGGKRVVDETYRITPARRKLLDLIRARAEQDDAAATKRTEGQTVKNADDLRTSLAARERIQRVDLLKDMGRPEDLRFQHVMPPRGNFEVSDEEMKLRLANARKKEKMFDPKISEIK